jgi:L-iditol 2-dehydrogenase
MIVGMGSPTTTLPLMAASSREVDLIGVFRYANTYPQAIEILGKSGGEYPDFSNLITHRFLGFENAPEAFNMAGKPKDTNGNLVIKVILDTGDNVNSKSTV